MIRRSQMTWCLLAALAVAVPASLAEAQGKGKGRGNPFSEAYAKFRDLPDVEVEGTIKQFAQGFVQVETNKGETMTVQLPLTPRGTRLTGSAEPSFLQPGMWVHFSARFNAKGEPVSPVNQLTVFTPGTRKEGEDSDYVPGVARDGAPGPAVKFSEDETAKKVVEEVTTFKVTGQINSFAKGKLSVVAAGTPVQVPLDEKAFISVDIRDLRAAQVGDTVEVRGKAISVDKTIAMYLHVTAQKPFAAPEPTKKTSKTTSKTTSKPSTKEKLPPLGEKSPSESLPPLGEKPKEGGLPPLGEKPADE